MRAPAFWWRERTRPGLRLHLLTPLASLYARGTARRIGRPPAFGPDVPTICVGNLVAGGSGKTPTVMALVSPLRERGLAPAIVTRGYGGRNPGPVRVDPGMPAAEVGDEALLLAAFAPVYVARDRAAAARMAVAAGAGALILDDGFQNPAVARDLNLVVVDAAAGFGNGRVLPAGPLREPVPAGLRRADALVVIGTAAARASLDGRWPETAGVPRLDAELRPLATGMDWTGMPVVAFAGIGRPQKFFDTLDGLGARVLRCIPLADHQTFGSKLLTRIERAAAEAGGQLVTTEKDAARLPPAFRRRVLTLPVRLEWDDPAALDALLARLPTRPVPRR